MIRVAVSELIALLKKSKTNFRFNQSQIRLLTKNILDQTDLLLAGPGPLCLYRFVILIKGALFSLICGIKRHSDDIVRSQTDLRCRMQQAALYFLFNFFSEKTWWHFSRFFLVFFFVLSGVLDAKLSETFVIAID